MAEFARRVVAVLEGTTEPVTVEVENRMDHPASFVSAFRRALTEHLSAAQVGIAEDPAGTRLKVTLSANEAGPLWIAEVLSGDSRRVALYAPGSEWTPAEGRALPKLSIESKLIWRQSEPLLDFAVDGDSLIALESGRVVFYERGDVGWQRRAEVSFTGDVPVSRDPRGRLQMFPGGFHAHLPGGLHCTGTTDDQPAVLCTEARFHWPVGDGRGSMTAGRNAFEGAVALTGDGVQQWPAFYSLVSWEAGGNRESLLAEAGGRTRVYSGGLPVAEFEELGSDVAPLAGPCAAGTLLVAALRNGNAASERVAAYEVHDHAASAVSEALALPGVVTALWPAGDGESLHAVVRDAKAGDYAAFRLSLRCPR